MLGLLVALASAEGAPAAPATPIAVDLQRWLPADAVDSPNARQVRQFGAYRQPYRPPARGALPRPTPGPGLRVYGYLPYWEDDLTTVQWDEITDIAIFSAGVNSDGSLYDTANWDIASDAVAMAAPYGVRVHLCVTNFSGSSLTTLLSSAANRNNLRDNLLDWVASTGADGVNIDFEGLPVGVKQQMVDFTADLDANFDDVVLATPAVDWSGAWDYSELTKHADVFIMGYGYHWGGSSQAGPNDPLYSGSGTAWSDVHSLDWTVNDYLTYDADPTRVILGLPLYGQWWGTTTSSFPATATTSGDAVYYSDAWKDAATYGSLYDDGSITPYVYDGSGQTWYGDTDSVRERIQYASGAGIAGIGFWALHYTDDAGFWTMVGDEAGTVSATTGTTGTTGTPGTTGTGGTGTEPQPSGDFHADAGAPFLAYVGDKVLLSAAGSTGPADVTLQYRWTQLAGPTVALKGGDTSEPSFTVTQAGTHEFELAVGDGTAWSAGARSYVVVIDPDAARRFESGGCGCDSTRDRPLAWSSAAPGAGLAVVGALAALLGRRRSA